MNYYNHEITVAYNIDKNSNSLSLIFISSGREEKTYNYVTLSIPSILKV